MVVDQMRHLRLSHLIGVPSVEIPHGSKPPRRPKRPICSDTEELSSVDEEHLP